MNSKQENFILQNSGRYSVSELARKLNLNEREIKRFLQRQQDKKKSVQTIPQQPRENPKILPWVFPLLFILGLLIYSNTFDAAFHFDDFESIEDNPVIKNISNLKAIWNYNQERFLTSLTFALNYHFGGLNVAGYHATNLTIHILATWLVFLLVQITLKTPSLSDHPLVKYSSVLAFFSSLLFLVHPVQTQAVTYIVQRMASLATLFYLASVFFYAKARLENKRLFYGLALFTTYASMLTKQISFTLPFALMLYEFMFFEKRSFKSRLLAIAPFLASAAVIPILMTLRDPRLVTKRDLIPVETEFISRTHYLLTQFNVIRTYLRLLFLPINQNLDYAYPISSTLADPPTFLSFLLHVSILALAFSLYQKHRIISFGIFWFYLTLSVESSVIPIQDVIYEHRLYLPIFGFVLAVSTSSLLFLKNIRIYVLFFIFIVFTFSWMTYSRNFSWKNELTLWEDVIKKSPKKARPYANVGFWYKWIGNNQKALEFFQKALELKPNAPNIMVDLGIIYGKLGETDKEAEYYQKAIRLAPDYIRAYDNLAVVYAEKREYEKAIPIWERVISLDPYYIPAYNSLAIAYDEMENLNKGMEVIHKSLAINPDYPETYYTLATVYARNGDNMSAFIQLEKLKKMNRPDLVSELEELLKNGWQNASLITVRED